ncbi:MAG: class II fumarate hydratase [Gammaproteobacteria bacterium]|nr:class II fumarate hydratase [Gammaproteobacteria bacterium]
MTSYRTVKDSMGQLRVPSDKFYGAQTQRAIDNFPISGLRMPASFIRALGLIKLCCARANRQLELLEPGLADAIEQAARGVADGDFNEHFPVDVFQTGSGTSFNMNANEVIAHVASQASGAAVHPNDHVNMGQSSNDVVPTAIHVSACLSLEGVLRPGLEHLAGCIESKMKTVAGKVKTGRTHLMDAMPVGLDQEMGGWARQVRCGLERLDASLPRLRQLAQGGTAVGTGINGHPDFPALFCRLITRETGIGFTLKPDLFEALSAQDAAVEMSGQLKTIAVSLMKISNDLRWMNSGPLAGLGEIELPALQPGSSIMPGKVNPVIPEAVAMVCTQVIGNDAAVTLAGQSGNFQLNVMMPVIAYNLLQSIELLGSAARVLADKAIDGFAVNDEKREAALARNPILVTALNRVIGYEKGAAIAKRAYREKRPILDVVLEETDLSRDEAARLLDPKKLTRPGDKPE